MLSLGAALVNQQIKEDAKQEEEDPYGKIADDKAENEAIRKYRGFFGVWSTLVIILYHSLNIFGVVLIIFGARRERTDLVVVGVILLCVMVVESTPALLLYLAPVVLSKPDYSPWMVNFLSFILMPQIMLVGFVGLLVWPLLFIILVECFFVEVIVIVTFGAMCIILLFQTCIVGFVCAIKPFDEEAAKKKLEEKLKRTGKVIPMCQVPNLQPHVQVQQTIQIQHRGHMLQFNVPMGSSYFVNGDTLVVSKAGDPAQLLLALPTTPNPNIAGQYGQVSVQNPQVNSVYNSMPPQNPQQMEQPMGMKYVQPQIKTQ